MTMTATRHIRLDLGSPSSCQKAIAEIEAYKNEIKQKLTTLVNSLVNEGIKVAAIRISSAQGDSIPPSVNYEINSDGDIIRATISLTGHDALFIEFGAGIAYNTGKQNPWSSELGYGPGTWPSEHPPNRAINPGRWIYGHNDDGSPIWSIGTEATMPLYGAYESVRNNAIRQAVEVFRS